MVKTMSDVPSSSGNLLKRAWAIVRADWRAYVTINVLYYGLVLLAMLYVAFLNPGLQEELLQSVGQAFTAEGPLQAVGEAYGGGQVLSAMVLTLAINLFLGTLLVITLPSLVVPFSGLAIGTIRAILWGLLLSPANPDLAMAMIPHSLTLLLEGQGYILALLAVFVHGKAILNPGAYGVKGFLRGYLEGLRRTAWIYLLVVLVLAAAAIYEALEVILLVPLLN
jgi:hypothetical protein